MNQSRIHMTASEAVEGLHEQQREIVRMKGRHRRELAEAVDARNLALGRAASHHIPTEELAAALRLSRPYVESLLRRLGSRG